MSHVPYFRRVFTRINALCFKKEKTKRPGFQQNGLAPGLASCTSSLTDSHSQLAPFLQFWTIFPWSRGRHYKVRTAKLYLRIFWAKYKKSHQQIRILTSTKKQWKKILGKDHGIINLLFLVETKPAHSLDRLHFVVCGKMLYQSFQKFAKMLSSRIFFMETYYVAFFPNA